MKHGVNASRQRAPARPAGGVRRDAAFADVLRLQRSAGNAAVAQLLSSRPTVQRHAGIEPAAAAHIPTAAEQSEMPTVAEAPELKKESGELQEEWKELNKKVKEAKAPTNDAESKQLDDDKKRLKEIEDRVLEIKGKLKVRVKGDEEETLKKNNIKGGPAAWFADVKTVTFLDKPATVHKLLADRLAKAQDVLNKLKAPDNGWVQEGHSTLRPPGESLHSFGVAIDLNPGTNPWLVRPTGQNEPAAWTNAYLGAIERAMLLVKGKKLSDDPFFSRPNEPDKDKRAEASYDKLKEASDALATYFTLADPKKLTDLEALLPNDPKKRTAKAWVTLIKNDKRAVTPVAAQKHWQHPEKGFLNLNKEVVKAMTSSQGAGLTWLGDDTIAGRDVMHFDMRGVGPIKGIWKSEDKTFIGLGNG